MILHYNMKQRLLKHLDLDLDDLDVNVPDEELEDLMFEEEEL